jgi:RHS repeat-associated protein
MDQLQYRYYANTNRLSRVQDAVSASAYPVDIDNQTAIENYSYDAIGNLSKDVSEEIEEIGWTVYGKIAYVHRTANSSRPDLEFGYDASGRRISKRVIQPGGETFTDYYVHDATGNTMAVYRYSEGETLSYKLQEWMLYGSSRLGVRRSGRELSSIVPQDPQVYVQERGHKRYELSSHLGNVHAVVSDARTTLCQNGTLLRYSAVVVNYTDYYAFGMSMQGREYAGNGYRYGYNGQEKLKYLHNQENAYEFKYRIYHAGIARFLSRDPLYSTYPFWTHYSFAANSPIRHFDLEGLESASNAPKAQTPPRASTGKPFKVFVFSEPKKRGEDIYMRTRYYNVSKVCADGLDKQNGWNNGRGVPVSDGFYKQTKGWAPADGPHGAVQQSTTNITSNNTYTDNNTSPTPVNTTSQFQVQGNPGDAVSASVTIDANRQSNQISILNATTGQTLYSGNIAGTVNDIPLTGISPGDVIQVQQSPSNGQPQDVWKISIKVITTNTTTTVSSPPGQTYTNDPDIPAYPPPTENTNNGTGTQSAPQQVDLSQQHP